jgi:hypothetical protein
LGISSVERGLDGVCYDAGKPPKDCADQSLYSEKTHGVVVARSLVIFGMANLILVENHFDRLQHVFRTEVGTRY